jgi:hypothetical protein
MLCGRGTSRCWPCRPVQTIGPRLKTLYTRRNPSSAQRHTMAESSRRAMVDWRRFLRAAMTTQSRARRGATSSAPGPSDDDLLTSISSSWTPNQFDDQRCPPVRTMTSPTSRSRRSPRRSPYRLPYVTAAQLNALRAPVPQLASDRRDRPAVPVPLRRRRCCPSSVPLLLTAVTAGNLAISAPGSSMLCCVPGPQSEECQSRVQGTA